MASSTLEESKLPGGYLVTPRVPQGLAAAVEGLTREIIRHSPEDIYVFAAHHFEKLLELREEYGGEGVSANREDNLRTLREISRALGLRETERTSWRASQKNVQQVGWSLNQTAKVLKRHRSIFGESGGRITTEEVFQMAKQKESRSGGSEGCPERTSGFAEGRRKDGRRSGCKKREQGAEESWKASRGRMEGSWSNEDSPEVSCEQRAKSRVVDQTSKRKASGGSRASPERTSGPSEGRRRESRRSECKGERNVQEFWKSSNCKTEGSWSNEESPEVSSELRSGPKIITQMSGLQSCGGLLAKDIKTELRRNRMSSRERRSLRGRPEEAEVEDSEGSKAGSRASGRHVVPRKSYERQRRVDSEEEEKIKSGSRAGESCRTSKDSPESRRGFKESLGSNRRLKSREESLKTLQASAPRSNKVKDYVVQRLASTKSLEELQSLNYVEKVQEIIEQTGPIIKGKVEELKSGMIGRSKRSSWFTEPASENPKRRDYPEEPNNETNFKDTTLKSREISGDALRTRLNETQLLLEDVSSKISRPKRSRSARSSRKSSRGHEDVLRCVESGHGDSSSVNGLERRLSSTRNLLEDISSTLSRPQRRSNSAKNLVRLGTSDELDDLETRSLRKLGSSGDLEDLETRNLRRLPTGKNLDDLEGRTAGKLETSDDLNDLETPKDALRSRLDETRNLLEGISASFASPALRRPGALAKGRRSRSNKNVLSEDTSLSEVSLPAVRSISTKSCSGGLSRTESDHLVLPAISPEAPKSKKVIEDLVLPVLSPPGTASSNEASKTEDFLEEDIPELPVEEVTRGEAVEDVFRDSLDVTPDFESIPQRPDSLEPPEDPKDEGGDEDGEKEGVAKGDVEEELGKSVVEGKLGDLEEGESRTQRISDGGDEEVRKRTQEVDEVGLADLEVVDVAEDEGEEVEGGSNEAEGGSDRAVDLKGSSDVPEEPVRSLEEDVEGGDRKKDEGHRRKKREAIFVESPSPEPLNYTYVLTEGSPYDIPDSVTTVIIPEPDVRTPDSCRLEEEPNDLSEENLLRVFGAQVMEKGSENESSEGGVAEEVGSGFEETKDKDNIKCEVDAEEKGEAVINKNEDAEESSQSDVNAEEKVEKVIEKGADAEETPKSPTTSLVYPEDSYPDDIKKFVDAEEPTPLSSSRSERDFYPDDIKQFVDAEEMSSTVLSKNGIEAEERSLILDPFGEVVVPEPIETVDIDLIRGMEPRQEIHLIRQDLDSINEEVLEEKDAEEMEAEELKSEEKEEIDAEEAIKTEENDVADTKGDTELPETDAEDPEDAFDGSKETSTTLKEKKVDEIERAEKEKDSLEDAPLESQDLEEVDNPEEGGKNCSNNSLTTKSPEGDEIRQVESPLVDPETSKRPSIPEELDPNDLEEKNGARDVEKSKSRTESEISPEASRPGLDSGSSNEAKESSSPEEEPMESNKAEFSGDEEESSESRSPESSNEVKETTLTDGLSYSMDPSRPFVPELNLDSLQDITVSSFKMTEDDYDVQGPAESANTNSIADTLTSDENHRLVKSTELPEEAVIEFLVSSSERPKVEKSSLGSGEGVEEEEGGGGEIGGSEEVEKSEEVEEGEEDVAVEKIEEPEEVVENTKTSEGSEEVEESKESVDPERVKEPEETGEAEESKRTEEPEQSREPEELEEIREPEEPGKIESVESEEVFEKSQAPEETKEPEEVVEETIVKNQVEVREDICEKKEAYVTGPKNDEQSVSTDVDEGSPRVELQEKQEEENKIEATSEAEGKVDATQEEQQNEEDIKIDSEELGKIDEREVPKEPENLEDSRDSEEAEKSEEPEVDPEEPEVIEEPKKFPEEPEVIEEPEKSPEEPEVAEEPEVIEEPEKSPEEPEVAEEPKVLEEAKKSPEEPEEVEEPDLRSTEASVYENSSDKSRRKMEEEASKDSKSESDELAEESFIEEETPLAVSRSASQCTTRRVSSGNLAKLREDPTLGWTEEPEAGALEADGNPSKVTFSKIGGQVIREQASEQSHESASFDDEVRRKDSREYHIYVPEVDTNGESSSTTESSTVDSAITKIQAGVRGFLTRRRIHRGQHNRSSTLNSIPSIQDSTAMEEPCEEEANARDPSESNVGHSDLGALSKPRKRLRREDAVQRTTLSMEKSFAESGLQHTGEFHDCIALPVHDITLGPLNTTSALNDAGGLNSEGSERVRIESEGGKAVGIDSHVEGVDGIDRKVGKVGGIDDRVNSRNGKDEEVDSIVNSEGGNDEKVDSGGEEIESVMKNGGRSDSKFSGVDSSAPDREDNSKESEENTGGVHNVGQMFFGQSANVPLLQFGVAPNVGHLVDLVILAKDDAALQSGYLNFITSVEDEETILPSSGGQREMQEFGEGNPEGESLKEPLALSTTPLGVVIEELNSCEVEQFLNGKPEKSNEAGLESSEVGKAPCASSESFSESTSNSNMAEDQGEDEEVGEECVQSEKSSGTSSKASEESKPDENLVVAEELGDLENPEKFSLLQEQELLGPESSVDSMDRLIAKRGETSSSRSSEEMVEASGNVERNTEDAEDVLEERLKGEEGFDSNAPSSTLSFSLKVEDVLGLGEEDSLSFRGRKPILEVTLTPGDIMKSMSLSQESQLAGERIESPITMVQMAPGRSESFRTNEGSDAEDEEPNKAIRSDQTGA